MYCTSYKSQFVDFFLSSHYMKILDVFTDVAVCIQPNCQSKCWQCMFLQTTDILKLFTFDI